MKRAAFVLALLSLLNPLWAEDPVYFPDAQLKTAVEEELWITDPTPTDMLGLTRLNAENRGIRDITGLEYATNLQTLVIRWNQISDLSPMAGLTNLQHLDAHGNGIIEDVSPLSGLVNLRVLVLRLNRISDISALSGLTDLRDFQSQCNHIDDLSPLAGLSNLQSLELSDNCISDVSGLSGLDNLQCLVLRLNPLRESQACQA